MSQEFFSPTKTFIDWLVQYKGNRTIVEAGCGSAPIARRTKGVIPIDLYYQHDQPAETLLLDATTFHYNSKYLVVLARPCHSDWTHKLIEKTNRDGAEVLYVGLEKNLEYDIPKNIKTHQLPNADSEHIVISIPPTSKMRTFVLLKTSYFCSWMEDDGSWYRNSNGGGGPKKSWEESEILEKVEAEDFCDLDWFKTDITTKNGDGQHGWIEPNGTFWPCSYMNHDMVIDLCFKRSVESVEKAGWTRVSGADVICQRTLTDAQISKLQALGKKIPEYLIGSV